ncbi:MAG: hypothetical protein IPK50_19550 [Fibrobacterota bacterium]|nr:MAG: hypothetical protein IPK50_19550 [Fibrobacterota bacterium]
MEAQEMATNIRLFYGEVLACNLGCQGIVRDPQRGFMPRGMWYYGNLRECELLVIGKNPGHPAFCETGLYKDQSKWLQNYEKFILTNVISENANFTSFHIRLYRYIEYILSCKQSGIWDRCAMTNLVKCSTLGEQDRLKMNTVMKCGNTWLAKEIEILGAKRILCLGNEAYDGMVSLLGSSSIKANVAKIKHPSYPIKKEDEIAVLNAVKSILFKS